MTNGARPYDSGMPGPAAEAELVADTVRLPGRATIEPDEATKPVRLRDSAPPVGDPVPGGLPVYGSPDAVASESVSAGLASGTGPGAAEPSGVPRFSVLPVDPTLPVYGTPEFNGVPTSIRSYRPPAGAPGYSAPNHGARGPARPARYGYQAAMPKLEEGSVEGYLVSGVESYGDPPSSSGWSSRRRNNRRPRWAGLAFIGIVGLIFVGSRLAGHPPWADGCEHDRPMVCDGVDWQHYPGIDAGDSRGILDDVGAEEQVAEMDAILAEVRTAVSTETGFAWDTYGSSPKLDQEYNSYQGPSLLNTYESAQWRTSESVSDDAVAQRIVDEVKSILLSHRYTTNLADPGSLTTGTVTLKAFGVTELQQEFSMTITDLAELPADKAEQLQADAAAGGYPAQSIEVQFTADQLLKDADRDSFESRATQYDDKTPPYPRY